MITSEKVPIYNLSLNSIIQNHEKCEIIISNIKNRQSNPWRFALIFENNDQLLLNESKLSNYHTENNQNLLYNKSYSLHTSNLIIEYEDFPDEEEGKPQNLVNNFLQNFFSLLLGFLQRRRVLILPVKIQNSTNHAIYLGNIISAEFTDSLSFGIPLINMQNLFPILSNFCISPNFEKIVNETFMILLRYKEAINLPYSYERIEIFWKILETLGIENSLESNFITSYQRIKNLLGMTNNSKSLKKIIDVLVRYNIPFTDDEIINSFNYRNKLTHEYLSVELLNDPNISSIFNFLNKSTELLILHKLEFDSSIHISRYFGSSQHRVT
ncbi:hypothetical protein [Leptospira idonii]|uniref:Apea-like HEPN domain-containing protein n=1 Tax=Leptospira idonii TaxID=1193500 RepID=A0A4R9M2S6_9LEPT|nr:hypothetical protein [Leptospira idonii]TGN19098.1 hypothetical protein EHS15_10565 [Leptospira idonii]